MPEYLAPGVYVEEIDTGSKPIEGVSTSTAGMVGVTERGPVNIPILVTSYGEYVRWFGERLNRTDFGSHCFLPHAVEGFFTNGGKRVFVTRILDTSGATKASQPMFDRGTPTSIETALLRAAPEGSGTVANPPALVVLPVIGLNANAWVRIGDGSTAEYRQAVGSPVSEDVLVPLQLPMSRTHAPGSIVRQRARTTAGAPLQLDAAAPAGVTRVIVRGPTADINSFVTTPDQLIEIGGANTGEHRFVFEATQAQVVSAINSTIRLRLDAPLHLSHDTSVAVARIDLTGSPGDPSASSQSALAGSGLLFVDARNGNFATRGELVHIQGAGQEVRRIGILTQLPISNHAISGYPADALVTAVTVTTDVRQLAAMLAGGGTETTLSLNRADGLVVGQQLLVGLPGPTQETVTAQAVDAATDTVTVTPAIANPHGVSDPVAPLPTQTSATVSARSRVLPLRNRLGLNEGDVLLVGAGASAEYVTIISLPGTSGMAPDEGNVVIYPALANSWTTNTPVSRQAAPTPIAGRQDTTLAIAAIAGAEELLVTDGDSYAINEVVRVTTPGGDVSYHAIDDAPTAPVAEVLTLQTALNRAHPAGSIIVERAPLFDVEALDAGGWGNRLRISVEDEPAGLVSKTQLAQIIDPSTIRLQSATGVQPGTVLELFDQATNGAIGPPIKVNSIDRATNFTLGLATNLTPAQQVVGLGVRSREFSLTVRLLRQPDPALPIRNEQVVDTEAFRFLSMDPRHSNYIERIIGDIDGPLRITDRRPEGGSMYIRVRDRAATQAVEEGVRPGPEPLVDVLPSGQTRQARHRLEQTLGADSIATLIADHYIGQDDPNPENRKGLHSLRNIEEISILSCPGQTGSQIQDALINHCELMRYRFAVLDGPRPPQDTLADVQNQRQQFDTKYAAIYHPWLLIPDPYPTSLTNVADYPIPPSGHMIGIYARTDIERGVHKAPANEVVRGVTGLQRILNKEQQDILNPFPININVIRDFRPNNRGIRVYGGRCITSDSDWKYVNVRRLLIFIEASIDRGLQWVVFEPNAEPLWARVRRSISNFLTLVWRNGALEGTKPEEAYFVKCDRTTMTQTDIDSGRLICVVGVAPVKPAEFVIIRIGLWTAHAEE